MRPVAKPAPVRMPEARWWKGRPRLAVGSPAGGRRRPASPSAGFTLLELIIVIAIIGILAAIAVPQLKDKPRRAQEVVLKTNLRTIRDALDQHYGDKGHYPPALETLVDDSYLRMIPIDPITGSNETWVVEYEEFAEDFVPAETDFGDEEAPGIIDVHSGSDRLALDGTPYSEW